MKVFLDDERTPPEGWTLVRWPEEVIDLLKTGRVEALSLDHDLGDEGDARTGYVVAKFVEEQAFLGNLPPLVWNVHSANPVARVRMEQAMRNADRYWAANHQSG